MKFRYSIRGLTGLVVLVGFTLGALRSSTVGWATAAILLALLTLCTATLGAMTRSRPVRGAWLGFAIFGWAYFLLHFGPTARWRDSYGPAHFTTWAIDGLIIPHIAPDLEYGIPVGGIEEFVVHRSGRSGDYFCAVIHSLASIVFGIIGAMMGLFFQRREVDGDD